MSEALSAAPTWFHDALDQKYDERFIDVGGTQIHYLAWGQHGNPGIVFVHGGAAHAHWWSFLAPMFATEWHAVAVDLSGHGDSDRRPGYSHDLWADEVLAVASDAAFPGPPVVVGHSLGGMVTIQTAATHGDDLAGAVIVDAPVRRPAPESEERRPRSIVSPTWRLSGPRRCPPAFSTGSTAALRQRLHPRSHRPAFSPSDAGRLDVEVRSCAVRGHPRATA